MAAPTTNIMPSFFSSVCLGLQIELQSLMVRIDVVQLPCHGNVGQIWCLVSTNTAWSRTQPQPLELLSASHHALTIFASAQPSSDCYGDVELLPFCQWEEFKLFYGSHTFLHFVSYTEPGRNTRLRDSTERTPSANSRSSLRN